MSVFRDARSETPVGQPVPHGVAHGSLRPVCAIIRCQQVHAPPTHIALRMPEHRMNAPPRSSQRSAEPVESVPKYSSSCWRRSSPWSRIPGRRSFSTFERWATPAPTPVPTTRRTAIRRRVALCNRSIERPGSSKCTERSPPTTGTSPSRSIPSSGTRMLGAERLRSTSRTGQPPRFTSIRRTAPTRPPSIHSGALEMPAPPMAIGTSTCSTQHGSDHPQPR